MHKEDLIIALLFLILGHITHSKSAAILFLIISICYISDWLYKEIKSIKNTTGE